MKLFYKTLTDGRTFSKLLLCIYVGEKLGFFVQDNVCTLFTIQPAGDSSPAMLNTHNRRTVWVLSDTYVR